MDGITRKNTRVATRIWITFLLGVMISPVFAGEAAEKEQPKLANTLKWTTASEVDNFGFDVYRAEKEDGPFKKITEQPIAGAGTTDTPQKYQFADETIEEGKAYYYYVESISTEGAREKFTPTFKASAKYRTSS